MTETRTSRFNLPQWSAGTDSPSRTDFNGAFSDIEGRGAYDTGDNVSSLPVTSLVAGRYSMLTTVSDGYSLYRYSGSAWQYVGGTLVPRYQRFKAVEGQASTDQVFTVEYPGDGSANIVATYGGDFTAGGVLKSWNANDLTKGSLAVGWNGALSLSTTGRAYLRTRANSELGLVLHAHGSGAGNMLTVREPGNSDIFTVDAIGRLTQRTFAAFGGATLPSTSMVAVAPTSAVDAITNGALFYGQSAATSKTIMQVLRDSSDIAPIISVGRDAITMGRLPWTGGLLTLASVGHNLRASGVAANPYYLRLRRSDPTSSATEANSALDTTVFYINEDGAVSQLPLSVTQRYRTASSTLSLFRVTDFTAGFVSLSRLVPDGVGGETTQLAGSWASDGRLSSGAWWRATGTTRDARQVVVHRSSKAYAVIGDPVNQGQYVAPAASFTYTWASMTCRSAGVTDLRVRIETEALFDAPGSGTRAVDWAMRTQISINGGSYTQIGASENVSATTPTGGRPSGDRYGSVCWATDIPAGATFALRTIIEVGAVDDGLRIRSMHISADECIVENYTAP